MALTTVRYLLACFKNIACFFPRKFIKFCLDNNTDNFNKYSHSNMRLENPTHSNIKLNTNKVLCYIIYISEIKEYNNTLTYLFRPHCSKNAPRYLIFAS